MARNRSFSITHADGGEFSRTGLRPFFEHRKLGIDAATKGAYDAHVVRGAPGMESPAMRRPHDLDFEMVWVLKGWVVFACEGAGEHMLRAGSCVFQTRGVRHREMRHSGDLEVLETVSPVEFMTAECGTP